MKGSTTESEQLLDTPESLSLRYLSFTEIEREREVQEEDRSVSSAQQQQLDPLETRQQEQSKLHVVEHTNILGFVDD